VVLIRDLADQRFYWLSMKMVPHLAISTSTPPRGRPSAPSQASRTPEPGETMGWDPRGSVNFHIFRDRWRPANYLDINNVSRSPLV